MARLCGGPIELIQLGEFEESIPELNRPIVLLVDYVNQRPTVEERRSRVPRSKASPREGRAFRHLAP
jgi:hypothetical protein